MKRNILSNTVLALLSSVLFINPALGNQLSRFQQGVDGVVVSYEDLNLSTIAGIESLYQRVESAAEKVCGTSHGKEPLQISKARHECVADTISSTVERIGNSDLQKMHQS